MRRRWLKRLTTAAAFLTAGAVVSVLVAWGLVVVTPTPTDYLSARRVWENGTLNDSGIFKLWPDGPETHDSDPRRVERLDRHFALAAGHALPPPPPASCYSMEQVVRTGSRTAGDIESAWVVWNRSEMSNLDGRLSGVLRVGWPWTCVEASMLDSGTGRLMSRNWYDADWWSGALRTPDWLLELAQHRRDPSGRWEEPFEDWGTILPCRPLWPGFLANTALYAAALWLPFFGATAWRRARRRRRNRCPACGYSRAGLAAHAPCPECGKPERAAVRAG